MSAKKKNRRKEGFVVLFVVALVITQENVWRMKWRLQRHNVRPSVFEHHFYQSYLFTFSCQLPISSIKNQIKLQFLCLFYHLRELINSRIIQVNQTKRTQQSRLPTTFCKHQTKGDRSVRAGASRRQSIVQHTA